MSETMPPSTEEEDARVRSRKKIRAGEGYFSEDQILAPRDEEWMHEDEKDASKEEGQMADDGQTQMGGERSRWKSFKEAVTKERDNGEEEEDWWSGDGWKERVSVEMTDKGPNVVVSPQEKARQAGKWKNALIVKLLGRMVRTEYLERKVQQLWACYGDVDVIDVGVGFHVVTFTDVHDYDLALIGGPWLLYDHYLSVQPWKPAFDPDREVINKVSAWIRLPKLPLDYYDRGLLYVIRSQVGRVLRVDMNTLNQKKGRFARLCVELDLSGPLCPMVLVDGREIKVQYEGIHLICFTCGRVGHDLDHCPSKKQGSSVVSVREQSWHCGSSETEEARRRGEVVGGGEEGPNVTYDSWMVVHRPRRARRVEVLVGKGSDPGRKGRDSTKGRGSWFAVLGMEDSREENMAQDQERGDHAAIAIINARGVAVGPSHVEKRSSRVDRVDRGSGPWAQTKGSGRKELGSSSQSNGKVGYVAPRLGGVSEVDRLEAAKERLGFESGDGMDVDMTQEVQNELQLALLGVVQESSK